MASYRINRSFVKDLRSQVKQWKKYAIEQVENTSERLIDIVGKLFVERARQNLIRNGYETERYAQYIYYDPRWKQVIVRSPSGDEPDIMWYLEFGTGIAGEKQPHPQASENGWEYAINKDTANQKGSPWHTKQKHPDGLGWYVSEEGRTVYHAENDHTRETGHYKRPIFFTSGIPPVRYLYDTMMAMPELIEKAKQILNAERK